MDRQLVQPAELQLFAQMELDFVFVVPKYVVVKRFVVAQQLVDFAVVKRAVGFVVVL